jgi:hypothetical protein
MTTKRRYLISAAILAACVGIALGVLVMLPPQPGVTKANFDRIEKRMTRAEVEAIFGRPEDFALTGAALSEVTGKNDYCVVSWHVGERGVGAHISFVSERVEHPSWDGPAESLSSKLRRWLRLPK